MTKTNKYLVVGYRKYDETKTMWPGVVESRNAAQAIRFYYDENVNVCVLISMEYFEGWKRMDGKDKLIRLERVWKENTYTDGEERVEAMKHLWSLVCGEISIEETIEESNGGPVVATEVEVFGDSGLLDDFTMEDSPWSELIIYGNRELKNIVGDDIVTTWDFINDIVFYMPETVEEFKDVISVPYEYDSIKYGTVEDICKKCSDVLHHGKDETDAVINILEILTGKTFKWTTLRGCCQSDWVYCYYPENIGDDIDAVECLYFGMLRHFDVDGCIFEVLDCEDAEKLLKAHGVDAVEYIDGYTSVPKYRRVEL